MQFQSCVSQGMLHAMSEVAFLSMCLLNCNLLNDIPVMWTSILKFIMCPLIREFDENLLQKISEVYYEDEVVTLPSAPDVSNYLMSEVFNL